MKEQPNVNPAREHDFSLNSGERQVGETLSDIRPDHRHRYEWAKSHLPRHGFGLDLFCGNGYGADIIGKNYALLSIDGSRDAIIHAQANYSSPNVIFAHKIYPFSLPKSVFDFVISLESIEHVENGEDFFAQITASLKPNGIMVYSTPCEEQLPFKKSGNKFHYKHFTLEETLSLCQYNGLNLLNWAGQNTYKMSPDMRPISLLPEDEMLLKVNTPGQFTIVAAQKK